MTVAVPFGPLVAVPKVSESDHSLRQYLLIAKTSRKQLKHFLQIKKYDKTLIFILWRCMLSINRTHLMKYELRTLPTHYVDK